MTGEYLIGVIEADGSGLDPNFGQAGIADTGLVWDSVNLGGTDPIWLGHVRDALLVDSQGRFVVVGGTEWEPMKPYTTVRVARLSAAGDVDGTYGNTPISTRPFAHIMGTSAAKLDADDNLIVAGCALDISAWGTSMNFVVRLDGETGELDPSFGIDGFLLRRWSKESDTFSVYLAIMDLGVDEDGIVLLLSGQRKPGDDDDRFGLTRLTENGVTDHTFPAPTPKLPAYDDPDFGGIVSLILSAGEDAARDSSGSVALSFPWSTNWWAVLSPTAFLSDAARLEISDRDDLLRVIYADSDWSSGLGQHQRVRFWKSDGSYDLDRNRAIMRAWEGSFLFSPLPPKEKVRVPGDTGAAPSQGTSDPDVFESGAIQTAKNPVDEAIAMIGLGTETDPGTPAKYLGGTYVNRLTAANENDTAFDPDGGGVVIKPDGEGGWAFFESEMPRGIEFGPSGALYAMTQEGAFTPFSNAFSGYSDEFVVRRWTPDGERDGSYGAAGAGAARISTAAVGDVAPIDMKVLDDGRIAVLMLRPPA